MARKSKSEKGEPRVQLNTCFEARSALRGTFENGDPRMSRREFSDLTGESQKQIERREKERAGITPTAAKIYALILELAHRGKADEVVETLVSIPEGKRDPGSALIALDRLCARLGLSQLPDALIGVVGDVAEEGGADVSGNNDYALGQIDWLKSSARGRAGKTIPEAAMLLHSAAAELASVYEKFRTAFEIEQRAREGDSPPEDPPDS